MPDPTQTRYTHDFDLTFAVENDMPDDVTSDKLWAALNERIEYLSRNPEGLIGEVWPPSQTIDKQKVQS